MKRIYEKQRAMPMPMWSPVPPRTLREESETPMSVRMNRTDRIGVTGVLFDLNDVDRVGTLASLLFEELVQFHYIPLFLINWSVRPNSLTSRLMSVSRLRCCVKVSTPSESNVRVVYRRADHRLVSGLNLTSAASSDAVIAPDSYSSRLKNEAWFDSLE